MKRPIRSGVTLFVVAALPMVGAAGCATAPIHTEPATSGIRAAEEVGAAKVPRAALHLQLAKEQLGQAKQLAAAKQPHKATSMLSRAEVDAELAVLLSREKAERDESAAAVKRVRELKHNIQ